MFSKDGYRLQVIGTYIVLWAYTWSGNTLFHVNIPSMISGITGTGISLDYPVKLKSLGLRPTDPWKPHELSRLFGDLDFVLFSTNLMTFKKT